MKKEMKIMLGLFTGFVFLVSLACAQAPMYTWHIQYNPTPEPIADVQYWNLDLFDVPNETMQSLKQQGVFVMCYFSAGSWEDWRPDADEFPEECMGNSNGWPGERWINPNCPEIRQIMANRIDLGIEKGCDGFDPDNMDAYGNSNGLGLTEQDAIDYYNFLANYAHSKGKKIGLKNALTIIDDVLPNMDWAVNEQCFQYDECFYLNQVIDDGKPVFHIEYVNKNKANKICPQAIEAGFSSLIKKTSLDEFEIPCSDYIENICGNGILEVNEECDDGNPFNNDACTTSCTNAVCGDGFIYEGVEECDDGNPFNNDACNSFCFLTYCGDNIIQSLNGYGVNEVCDGNDESCFVNSYLGIAECNSDCLSFGECVSDEYCGDFIVNGNEECDGYTSCTDDNGYAGIANCSFNCSMLEECISNEYCGDFIVNGNEECDEGILGSDTCNPECQFIFSQIAYDGFEDGWYGGTGWTYGWYHQGDANLVTNDLPYEGSYHLRLRRGNGYVDRMLDLSSYSSATLSFHAKVKSFERDDFADFLISSDGSNWEILKTFTPADSDNEYHYYEYDITPYLSSNVWIAIDAEMSGTGDYLYIDNVEISN